VPAAEPPAPALPVVPPTPALPVVPAAEPPALPVVLPPAPPAPPPVPDAPPWPACPPLVPPQTAGPLSLLQAPTTSKQPIAVRDVTGFAVNRMLHAMLIEAVRLVEEGVATPEDLDTACRLGLGHPIGPFALMDKVSASLCLQVQEILQDAYGERFRPPALLKQRVAAGLSGGKGRPGWIDKAR